MALRQSPLFVRLALALGGLLSAASAVDAGGGPRFPATGPVQDADSDFLGDARSKEPEVRERAARGLGTSADPKAESALVKLLGDEDVLVQLAAIESMADRESTSVRKGLVKLALGSPFLVVRRAATRALTGVDPDAARVALLKKASGKTAIGASEALVWWAEAVHGTPTEGGGSGPARSPSEVAKDLKKLKKLRRSKKSAERVAGSAAAVALSVAGGEERAEVLTQEILERAAEPTEAMGVSAALEGLRSAPDPGDLAILRPLLDTGGLSGVVERRLERAALASLAAMDDDARDQAMADLLGMDGLAVRGPRIARIVSAAGSGRLDRGTAKNVIVKLLATSDVDTRAAAAKALQSLGEDGVELALKELRNGEIDGRTGIQCVRCLAAHLAGESGELEPKVRQAIHGVLAGVLGEHGEEVVRAEAAVALARPLGEESATKAPEGSEDGGGAPGTDVLEALMDAASTGHGIDVRNCATVALGRTRRLEALPTLEELIADDDWMVRAAAAEGLKQLSILECVTPLLVALEDTDAQVRATAHQALLSFSGRAGQEVDPSTWADWWKENGARATFRTREEDQALKERYGYGTDDAAIYRGLDVVVIPGRGDHIELVLERLGIQFRIAQAGQVAEAGLHPGAILMVGCTGEVAPEDIEVIQWYVRTGGALFTSCWALTHTVTPTYPAVIAKFPSPGEVMDNVFADPAPYAASSPYLRGVFEGGVRPFYSLVGAHLIHVIDPERAVVLLDSPAAAARHGSGDLAAYFRAGHGVVLDTANHFEEQGFASAQIDGKGLKEPLERQAFAVNHMGFSLKELRTLKDEKWWKSSSKTAQEVADLSVFRILTNFVREKRING